MSKDDEQQTSHWPPATSRFLSLLFVICYLLFVFCSCVSHQPANSPLEIPGDFAGLVHAGESNTSEEYALIDSMGASWLLATFYWSRIEATENQWNFDSYDRYVDTALAAGKKVIGVLGYDVSWIHDDGNTHYYIPQDKLHFFLGYVQRTAGHFRGRVSAWCIWNEPNFQFWKGSKNEFFELSRLAADALREIDPDVVLLGGAFNRGIFGLPKRYIRGLFESGAMDKADGVAFHPYELNPARTAKLYGKFRAIAGAYGYDSRIWITEVGYPTGGWYPTATTEKKFPVFVVKTFVNLAAGGVQKILWYELFDSVNRSKRNSEDYFGLVRSKDDYSSKGAEAFSLCALNLAGTVYRPDLPLREGLPKSLKIFYFEKPNGEGALVFWKEGKPVRLSLDGAVFTTHDPVSGYAEIINSETVITVGSMPVFIAWEKGNQPRLVRKRR